MVRININLPKRRSSRRPSQRHQIARIQKTEAGPASRPIRAAGNVQSTLLAAGKFLPCNNRNALYPDGVNRTHGLAQTTPIAALRRDLTGLVPAILGTYIPAIVTFCLFIVIIKAAVFINHKKSHSECFDMPGEMSCRKILFAFPLRQGFQKKLANSIMY